MQWIRILNLKLGSLAGLALLVVFCTTTPAYAGESDFIIKPQIDDITTKAGGTVVELPNGNRLHFLAVQNGKGQAIGYGVGEYVKSGNKSVKDIEILREADPLTLFYAVTERRTSVPEDLQRIYKRSSIEADQGWARPELLSGGNTAGGSGNCAQNLMSFANFENDVKSYGYPLVFLSEDDGPNTIPGHWFGMGGFVYEYDKLQGAAYDVYRFYTRVTYCERDPESNEYPWITLKYRKDSSSWITYDSVQVFSYGDEFSFWWDPLFSPIDPDPVAGEYGTKIDFYLKVAYGYNDDKFWIGATWSKPFTTITSEY